MIRHFIFSAVICLTTSCLQGEIFADVTVRHGDQPLGTFRVMLDHEKAPRTCANFIGLADGRRAWLDESTGAVHAGRPFYDGLTFHRLIHNFMIQGGSRNGKGTDSPGFTILDEYHPQLRHSGRYIISMAKGTYPNSGGSQFFITLAPSLHLDDKHSVFGEVVAGREIIDGFANSTAFPTAADAPVVPIVIESVTLGGADYPAFPIDAPEWRLPFLTPLQPIPHRDPVAKTFKVTFPRKTQVDYRMSFTTGSFQNFTLDRHLLSLDEDEDFEFVYTSVDLPRLFMRVAAVDYSRVPNAPASLIAAGSRLSITSRAGAMVEITFNGSGGGTWTHSSGSSGTLSGVTWNDFAGSSSFRDSKGPEAIRIPLGLLEATFSSPGPNNWSTLVTYLSFHTPTTGYLEDSLPNARGHRFVWTP